MSHCRRTPYRDHRCSCERALRAWPDSVLLVRGSLISQIGARAEIDMGSWCQCSLANNKSIKYLTYYMGRQKSRYNLMNTTLDPSNPSTHQIAKIQTTSPAYQAFRLLHIGFVAAPILAGMDKFPLARQLGSIPPGGGRTAVANRWTRSNAGRWRD